MSTQRLLPLLVVLLFSPLEDRVIAQEKETTLTAKDKQYLDGLIKEFLFDPKGAQRVIVPTAIRIVWASSQKTKTEGWFVAGKNGKPGRVYFTDGESILAPPDKVTKKVDYVAVCKQQYASPLKKERRQAHVVVVV